MYSIHNDEVYIRKSIFDTAQFLATLMFRKTGDVDVLRTVKENINWLVEDYIKIQEDKNPAKGED